MLLDESRLVRLPRRLDGTSVPSVRTVLYQAIDRADGDVVMDMSDVELVDLTGLGLLAAAHERIRRHGYRLVLRDPQPAVRRTLARTRLGRVLRVGG